MTKITTYHKTIFCNMINHFTVILQNGRSVVDNQLSDLQGLLTLPLFRSRHLKWHNCSENRISFKIIDTTALIKFFRVLYSCPATRLKLGRQQLKIHIFSFTKFRFQILKTGVKILYCTSWVTENE